ncbi:urea active transporter [Nitrosopumilus sp. b1]|uniref:sodium:solute symporter family transporter n=1 Tax=Nitrosopumilus sp. b1 TaxID=2109907 RepID=UPI0015F4FDBA|nr:sodium/solute symporter [Nitrosopumilus sp. b1]KAF6243282.1 urea active transporter [Nitrosopumilus sp. b1]
MSAILTENIGYVVLLGVGLFMALAVTLMVKAETKWLGTRKTSEWFYTAGRTIKTGLIASSIVSAWTWAATLLQSSTVTFQFGMAGAFWYAAGASIQVILFSILAIELKRKAPMTHTFPEMLFVRFGKHSHKVFLFFALMTNTVVTAMLVLGGAAVVNSLTGVDITIAAFLIPLGIIVYTIFGGLKATFFAEYLNSAFIFVVILVFVTSIYFVSPEIGGINGMYEKLTNASILKPVEGNAMGMYLTLASTGALIFGIINIVGNFGTVFVDQSYWQRAIAARPKAATGGFILGGLAWFAIPFTLATTLGLAAIATGVTLSPSEIELGLVAPTTAANLLGDLGAILILTIIFTAVTAAGSSQLVSVSSLVTYDVYRTYIKPASSGRELMTISRFTILIFGVGMGILASILFQFGVSLQYVYLLMGILIGSAVAPISFGILWKKTNKFAATSAAIIGLVSGVVTWILVTNMIYGEISIATTGNLIPLLIGNLTSIGVSLGITLGGSLIKPESFDFASMKQKILLVDDRIRNMIKKDTDEETLSNASKFCIKVGFSTTLFLVVAWPLSLYFSDYIFSLSAFYIWIWMAFVWAIGAATIIIILPLIEARRSIGEIFHKANQSTNSMMVSDLERLPDNENREILKILVPIDGSIDSLKALNHANFLLKGYAKARIHVLHVIQWTDEQEENMDEEMTVQMQEEGRRVLRSVIMPKQLNDYERIVKLGDPPSKIAEIAEKLGVDLIVMGKTGLGKSKEDLGNVTSKVLKLTSKPVVLIN